MLAVMTGVSVSVREWRDRGDGGAGAALGEVGPKAGTTSATRGGAPLSEAATPSDGAAPLPAGEGNSSERVWTVDRATSVGVALLLVLSGCADPAPRPLHPGVDGCADCLMVLEAGGHGAQLVTRTGKVYTFDSAECLVNHLRTSVDDGDAHSAWVTDFASPESLVPAEEAYFLVSPTLGSPMGLGVTAFARQEDRDGAVNAFGGRAADWEQVKALVAEAWPEGRPAMRHGGHTAELALPASAGASGG